MPWKHHNLDIVPRFRKWQRGISFWRHIKGRIWWYGESGERARMWVAVYRWKDKRNIHVKMIFIIGIWEYWINYVTDIWYGIMWMPACTSGLTLRRLLALRLGPDERVCLLLFACHRGSRLRSTFVGSLDW
jgi:hypothetical protein